MKKIIAVAFLLVAFTAVAETNRVEVIQEEFVRIAEKVDELSFLTVRVSYPDNSGEAFRMFHVVDIEVFDTYVRIKQENNERVEVVLIFYEDIDVIIHEAFLR